MNTHRKIALLTIISLTLTFTFLAVYQRGLAAIQGSVFTVNSFLDEVDANPNDGICRTRSNVCTLRAAIQQANRLPGFDTIQLPAGDYSLTIAKAGVDNASNGDLDITGDVLIQGMGAESHETTIGASNSDRVFEVTTSAAVQISNLTIHYTRVDGPGGGIYNRRGNLTLDHVQIMRTLAQNGGGIFNEGELTIRNGSYIGLNEAANNGAGIYNSTTGQVFILENSLIFGNTANCDSAITFTPPPCTLIGDLNYIGGGGIYNQGELFISESEVSNNHAYSYGTESTLVGGAGVVNFGKATIENATLTSNASIAMFMSGLLVVPPDYGGAILNMDTGVITLTNSTLANSYSTYYGSAIANFGDLRAENSNIAGGNLAYGMIYNTAAMEFIGSSIRGANFVGIVNQESGELTLSQSTLAENLNSGMVNLGEANIIESIVSTNVISNVMYTCSECDAAGINNLGNLTILGSSIQANVANFDGHFLAGGISNRGAIWITNSSITNNISNYKGGGLINFGTTNISGSLIANNSAEYQGGGIFSTGILTVNNSTLSGNRAKYAGGGIALELYQNESFDIRNTTITGNITDWAGYGVGDGGGLFLFWDAADPDVTDINQLTIQNTIISGNMDNGGEAPDCAADIRSLGFNLIQNPAGCTGMTGDDIVGLDALLGLLQDNGGLTLTHALLAASPARDAANNAECLPVDQRGMPRPTDGDDDGQAFCDIGAFEAQTNE